jgi:hypothetical protein
LAAVCQARQEGEAAEAAVVDSHEDQDPEAVAVAGGWRAFLIRQYIDR